MAMAEHIAKQPMVGLKLAKQSVNQMQDAQGLWPALQAAMSLQHMGHAHERLIHQRAIEPKGEAAIREQAKKSNLTISEPVIGPDGIGSEGAVKYPGKLITC